MSRSGYTVDCEDDLRYGRWRAQVASAIRGERGQAFLRDLLAALEAMPEKELIADDLEADGEVCAIGALGRARGIDMGELDPEDPDQIAAAFNIASQLAQEIAFENDEQCGGMDSANRWIAMRDWAKAHIKHIDNTKEVAK